MDILRVVAGFLLTCCFVAAYMMLYALVIARSGLNFEISSSGIMYMFILSIIIMGFSIVPAIFVLALSEAKGIRSVYYYSASGLLVSLVVLEIVSDLATTDGSTLLYFVTSGVFGGVFYWLIAGKHAGSAKQRASKFSGPRG
ncbi:hypothetical protein [Roseibium sediminis]|uniref:hypothetical protein n=1 Tax=Roseibium sediminis TaxID=1775174 RepID=UPI00123CC931|nr:hypothetical protein [Roseibium sediminis]